MPLPRVPGGCEEAGDYSVYLVPGLFGSEMGLQPNWNVADPIKQELIRNRNFRIALSVAINRDEINAVIYFGQGTPRQATVPESFPVYDDAWTQAHAQYDPELANQLLDEIGLTARDGKGFRLAADGGPLQFTIHHQTIEIGSSRGELPGEQPPEWIEEHDRRIYQAQQTPEQSEEYRRLITQIAETQAENLFWIGTVGQVPVPVVAQNRVGNVMTQFVPRHVWTGGLSEFADQLYLKDQ